VFGISFTSIVSWLAIYVVVWWVTIFLILPIGLHGESEGAAMPGADPGAPATPRLKLKALITTGVSLVIVAGIYVAHAVLG
jgi:predicted secreted protein